MAIFHGHEHGPVHLLETLVALEHDAVEGYRSAIARVDDARDREALTEFMGEHERMARRLRDLIAELGGDPGREVETSVHKGRLARARVAIGDFTQGEAGILKNVKANEDVTAKAFERAYERDGLPEPVLRLVREGEEMVHGHRRWMEMRLDELEGPHLE